MDNYGSAASGWARLPGIVGTVVRYADGGTPMTQIREGDVPSAMAVIPFRRATTFRTTRLQTTTAVLTAAEQVVNETIEGSGYVYGIDLDVACVTAANAAATAFHEDAPWSALTSVVFADVNGELINMDGFSLWLVNLYGGWHRHRTTTSTDVSIYSLVTGAGATGGSFRFHLFVPVALNRRTLLGLLGNQDRAQKYSLRSNVAAGGVGGIYTTAPTNPGTVTIQRTYENYAVPAAANAQGTPQEIMPPKFGVLHYATQVRAAAPPVSSATVNHYLPRLGNTLRFLILVFRDGNGATARTDSEANVPTQIKLLLGDTPIFSETAAYRRMLMFTRYGFDAPAGVFVYDFITDIVERAGAELGDDYVFTNGLVNAQFEVTYPAGWAANSSLTIITDDLQVPNGVDLYA